jgi:mRNA interferase MazF
VICDFGDVAIVPFPFTDLTISKVRPAVVLSKRDFNEENGNTILAMITTAKRSVWPSDILLADADAAGLRQDCYVRWKVFTLTNEMLQRCAGTLSVRDLRTVKSAVKGLFA